MKLNCKNTSLNDIIETVKEFFLRFFCSFDWLALLCAFSFFDLIDFCMHTSNHSFSLEIVSRMQSIKMVISNIGLIGMAYVDNIIASMLTGHHKDSNSQKLVLVFSIVLALFLTLISMGVDIKNPDLRWEALPTFIFGTFLVMLFIYKMSSLEVSHDNGVEF